MRYNRYYNACNNLNKKRGGKMKKILKIILSTIIIIALLIIFFKAAEGGLEKMERIECLRWQETAKTIPGFWLTPWQKAQCDHWGIEINAPVRGKGGNYVCQHGI